MTITVDERSPDMALEKEMKTYEEKKDQLLANAGKFVLIFDSNVVGIWDTYEDALKAAYQKYGVDKTFLVKKIEGVERIQFCSRNVSCPV